MNFSPKVTDKCSENLINLYQPLRHPVRRLFLSIIADPIQIPHITVAGTSIHTTTVHAGDAFHIVSIFFRVAENPPVVHFIGVTSEEFQGMH
jgi:hypothetical protein